MTSSPHPFTPAWRLRDQVVAGEFTASELLEQFLARIDELDSTLGAFTTVCADQARADAQQIDRSLAAGRPPRRLAGVPVCVKDVIHLAGVRSTAGSLVYADHVPTVDAELVGHLRAEGAVVFGTTATSELCLSATTESRLGGICRSPWDPSLTPGGSSGGAGAALAAGLCPLAVGTDGGGSVRIPASFCGVYGLKPTRGAVSNAGLFDGWPPFLHISGPMTLSVHDAALTLDVIGSAPGAGMLAHSVDDGVASLRVAWSPDLGFASVDPAVVSACALGLETLEAAGAHVEEILLGWSDPFELFAIVFAREIFDALGHLLERRDELDAPARAILRRGSEISDAELSSAYEAIDDVARSVDEVFDRYDLLVTPATATAAFPIGQRPTVIDGTQVDGVHGFFPFTYLFNITGNPAASVPSGHTPDGRPVGLQLVAAHHHEELIVRASRVVEQALPWLPALEHLSSRLR